MSIDSIKQLPLEGKKVLVRVDFNVPIKEGRILDPSRIEAALPTLQYLLSKNCAVIVMSHLGRPKGRDPALSLAPVGKELETLLGKKVTLTSDFSGEPAKKGEVLLLENLRFHEGEEKPEKDPAFAQKLAALADFYVDDAFGCAHRAHASVVGVPLLMKGRVAAGFLLEKEIHFLGNALAHPKRPFLALIGGAKISSKIGVLKALSEKVDGMAVGGGMAFTFLKAQGFEIGDSLYEADFLDQAKGILESFKKKNVPLFLPSDFVIAKEVQDNAAAKVVSVEEGIPAGYKGLDIGPKTVQAFSAQISGAQTILWNGPMGVFEVKPFDEGTKKIAEAFAKSSGITIAGGGETIAAILQTPWKDQVSHLSTGGGAALEYLELGTLPGIEALKDR